MRLTPPNTQDSPWALPEPEDGPGVSAGGGRWVSASAEGGGLFATISSLISSSRRGVKESSMVGSPSEAMVETTRRETGTGRD